MLKDEVLKHRKIKFSVKKGVKIFSVKKGVKNSRTQKWSKVDCEVESWKKFPQKNSLITA